MRFAGGSSLAAGLMVWCLLVTSADTLAAIPARSVTINGVAFVRVPAGPFTMGTPVEQCVRAHEAPGTSAEARADARAYCARWESPPHQVTLPAFYIMRTEVTIAQYNRFVQATGARPGAPTIAGAHRIPGRRASTSQGWAFRRAKPAAAPTSR